MGRASPSRAQVVETVYPPGGPGDTGGVGRPGTGDQRVLTVIILTYNSGQTLGACLASLLVQSVAPAEIIVVDDASTDETLAIAREFKDRASIPVRVLHNGSHRIARGRNIGILAACTPIIVFMDSDAWADAGWVEELLGTFEAEPEVGIVGGEVLTAHASSFAHALAVNDGAVREFAASGELLCGTCNMGVHLERVGGQLFDERWVYAEDVEYVHRVSSRSASSRSAWTIARTAKVWHESRRGPVSYFQQMWRYGLWKVHYTIHTRNGRMVDYLPSVVIVLSCALAVVWPLGLLALPVLSLAQALFVAALCRPSMRLLPLMVSAWMIKNTGWGLGVLLGLWQVASGRGPNRGPEVETRQCRTM